jgi:hypothetical protein
MAYYRLQKSSGDSGSLTPIQKTALRFRTVGFTSDDFQRFTHSGLSESEWSASEQKSVAVAGLMGLSPIGSGFFYTHDIGIALFLSLAKVGAIVGMIPFNGKGGEDKNMRWIYPVVYGGATLFDITGSMTASHTYNLRLAALKSSSGNAQANLSFNSLSALATIQF